MNIRLPGAARPQHLTAELFKLRTGTSIVHVLTGQRTFATALLGGEVEMTFATYRQSRRMLKGSVPRARHAGVKRADQMPEVRRCGSRCEWVEVVVWNGVLATAATRAKS